MKENVLNDWNEEKKVDVTLLLKNKPEIDEEVLKKYDDADVDAGSSDGFDSSRWFFIGTNYGGEE